jgi:NADH:ubiquinone oxidoreductase subunit F (NADH-binding)/(2Fe-2S) ferredoxin
MKKELMSSASTKRTTPLVFVKQARQQAVRILFETKFKYPTRITVGSATCENAPGSEKVYEKLVRLIKESDLKNIVISRVGCVGRCSAEPVVTVITSHKLPVKYVNMTPEKAERVFREHVVGGRLVEEFSMSFNGKTGQVERVVAICSGINCLGKHSLELAAVLKEELIRHKLSEKVAITYSACQGLCERGPMVFILPDEVYYHHVTPALMKRIVEEHFIEGSPLADHIWRSNRLTNRFFPIFGDIDFFGKQLRLTLRNCGVIDPESLNEYLAVRGYEAAALVLEKMSSQEVIDAIAKSGLRGRGGGGYATGQKWRSAASQKSAVKYIICNADEGDPGAFMDRSTIEGDPHTVLEGIIIGAYAIGASKGYIYIRAEYPLAIKRLEKAILDARKAGFLGENIFGTSWNFDIELRLGAGAFVCGEETALLRSIEGERGMPMPRPPYPAESGLWDAPTVINNVETFANVPLIILDGAEWFASIGTAKSKGTKVFALAGKVVNNGLIEVPMGTTLRDVVYEIGGGIKNKKTFKAVQTGGPAGGCLPASSLNTPIDYESLTAAGSIMGSGGMIVMDEDTCMVDVAKYFLDFTQSESCGKCIPCREGTKRMLEILQRITAGKGQPDDIAKLLRLGETIKKASLCGLGQAAPNPVLSTITHFRNEYEAHIKEKRCPAKVCTSLIGYEIDAEKCVGCGACKKRCPVQCIDGKPKEQHVIDQAKCIHCGACFMVCKFNAVLKK